MLKREGRELTPAQLAEIDRQMDPGTSRDDLLAAIDTSFRCAEEIVRCLDPATLADARTVGRRKLPTTVIGLLTHIAEHTTRHVAEAIVSAKWARL